MPNDGRVCTDMLAPSSLIPPMAAVRPHKSKHHGYTIEDPYFWLRDPGYPDVQDKDVLEYLDAENKYFTSVMQSQENEVEALYQEIRGRIKEDEESVPWQEGKYDYRWAFDKGAQYRTWYYRPRTENPFVGDDWQVLLDETQEAHGKEYFKLGSLSISPNGQYLAYSSDTNGSERYTIYVRDLKTGENLSSIVCETSGEIVWNEKSTAFAAVKVSEEWRPYKVIMHKLGSLSDRLIFEEVNTSFFVSIQTTTSNKYMVIRSADHVTAENYIVPLSRLTTEPTCMMRRRPGHDYYVDHGGTWFYVRSNRDHKNFSIFRTPDEDVSIPWRTVLEGGETRYLHGMQAFDSLVAVEDRNDGLDRISLLKGCDCSQISLPEDVCEVSIGHNAESSQPYVRLTYSSLITPPTVYDYQLETGELVVRKVQEIPSGYDKNAYISERLMITARDGVQVPVSIVYHKDWEKGTDAPLHLYGYGAYGLGMPASFSAARLSLLDRGFAYAIAHVRGGDEMGYPWYEAGKLEHRTNTFNDFVDAARALVARDYVKEGRITISGGSAGGELMGAVVNQAPDLFAAVVLHVPFVDVLNTMLDGTLPLTPIEWPEWGNPIEDRTSFETIKSYCPYTNIKKRNYPAMLVTAGLNDPRVTYWEPAKWTAKIRAMKTDDNLLLLKTNMGAGHGGKSGRFERLHETAEEYAFLLMCTASLSNAG